MTRAPTKAGAAALLHDEESRAIRALDCRGCPYAGCVGATATLTWEQMGERDDGEYEAWLEAYRHEKNNEEEER